MFFFFLLPQKKPHCFTRVSIFVTTQLRFSKLHFPGEIFFSQEVWSILSLFPHLPVYYTGRKSISSVLEKPLTTTYSRPYSESPGGCQTGELQLHIPSQMFHAGTRGVTTTAGDHRAPARKLLRLSQRLQLQEHCCLLRYWNVPHPAVLHWALLNEMKEDC